MQVKSIAECSPWSILQYFRPSLSYHLSLRSLFNKFLSGHLRQVLLYLLLIFFLDIYHRKEMTYFDKKKKCQDISHLISALSSGSTPFSVHSSIRVESVSSLHAVMGESFQDLS